MTTTAHEDQFTPAPVEVTQGDRDRAWNTGLRLNKTEWEALYDAFARHRIASAPAGEVVAYKITDADGGYWFTDKPESPDAFDCEITQAPLYAHPPAPADLVEALRWYQEQVSNCNRMTDDTARNELARDLGQRAAVALAKHGGA